MLKDISLEIKDAIDSRKLKILLKSYNGDPTLEYSVSNKKV